ncbi:hypothetical protein NMG60_11000377 [Bertholletia excelsa]
MEKSRANSSSPLATIEEIQRRLTRPPSLRSQSTISYATARKSAAKERDAINKRLEDYLDPVLLSAIRAKIGRKRNREGAIYKPKELEIAFEWPVDELKALGEGSMSEKGAKWRGYEAVDLGDDVGGVRVGGGGEDEAFEMFEREARKRFRR